MISVRSLRTEAISFYFFMTSSEVKYFLACSRINEWNNARYNEANTKSKVSNLMWFDFLMILHYKTWQWWPGKNHEFVLISCPLIYTLSTSYCIKILESCFGASKKLDATINLILYPDSLLVHFMASNYGHHDKTVWVIYSNYVPFNISKHFSFSDPLINVCLHTKLYASWG